MSKNCLLNVRHKNKLTNLKQSVRVKVEIYLRKGIRLKLPGKVEITFGAAR